MEARHCCQDRASFQAKALRVGIPLSHSLHLFLPIPPSLSLSPPPSSFSRFSPASSIPSLPSLSSRLSLWRRFVRGAFPDNTVLHPKWMDDFKQHVWEWGYRHSASADDSSGSDDGCAFETVNAVRIMPGGKTQYRCTKQGAESEWIQVEPSTAKSFHRLACSFLFRSIGVVSFHMGRMQLRHLLKHLNVDEVFQKGWEDFNEEAQASAKDGCNNNNEEPQATSGDGGEKESEKELRGCSSGEAGSKESGGNEEGKEKDEEEEEGGEGPGEVEAIEEKEERGIQKEKGEEKEDGGGELEGEGQDGDEVMRNGREDEEV